MVIAKVSILKINFNVNKNLKKYIFTDIFVPRGCSGSPLFTKGAKNVLTVHGLLSQGGTTSYSYLPYVFLNTGSYIKFFNKNA